MPNPLSKVKPDAGYILATVGSFPLRSNERLARLAMEGVSSWADVEFNLLQLYITLAGGASADAAAVFLSIESDAARKGAIAALADLRLDDEQKKLFSAILKLTKQRIKSRNKLAHWVWGYSSNLPDALLLADPKGLVVRQENANDRRETARPHGDMRDDIFVFTESDFVSIIHSNEETAKLIFLFNWIVLKHPAAADGGFWREISETPAIAHILNGRENAGLDGQCTVEHDAKSTG